MANTEFDLQGVNHLALVCKDMARTVDFYTNVLGWIIIDTMGDRSAFLSPAGRGPP